tara:strand:+ start:7311 stop:8219 length:909 start_codon:yes stop_codon:yes gene_type:complete
MVQVMDFVIDSLYSYAGEVLTEPTTIFVIDHHYDEENDVWPVQQLLDASPCEHTLILGINIHDDVCAKYNPIVAPCITAYDYKDFHTAGVVPDWTNKTVPFNFMINKLRPHRIKLLQMIEAAQFANFTYSLPWMDNPYSSLSPTNYMIGTETQMAQGIKSGPITNSENYIKLLQKNVFEPSCISLITEPTYIEKEAQLSEKTIMAIYGGTIPIYIGGWRCADSLKLLGFDVFDDIVDHSYETLEDPWERIEKAFYLNKDLLENFTMTNNILVRLQHNLDLLTSEVFDREAKKQLKGIVWPIY